ncbi:hypothetical protein Taro_048301, partial [Colocasia esculenta]|nr:hypothetical protein [Colocasia esculenta]
MHMLVDIMKRSDPNYVIFCKGSVDTPLIGVDTMLQTQDKIMQNWSSSVDTRSGSVDTRDSSQKTFWPIWDSVSTLAQENMLKYLLPIDDHVEQMLHDDGDVHAMFDLQKCQGTSFINLQIQAVDSRCLSTHASRQSGDPPQLVMGGNRISTTTGRSTSDTYDTSLETTEMSQLPGSSLELYDDRTNGVEGQNDSIRLTVRCNVDVFPWRLHASVIRQGPEFAITNINNIQNCGCDIMSERHPRTSKKWVANAMKGKLLYKPTYRASEMMRDIRQEYGISIPYHQESELALPHWAVSSCGTAQCGSASSDACANHLSGRPGNEHFSFI